MGWSDTTTTSLTLPTGAGPNDPRLLLGPDLPPNLAHLSAAIVWYGRDQNGALVGHYYGTGLHSVAGTQIEVGFFPNGATLRAENAVQYTALWRADGSILPTMDFPNSRLTFTSGRIFGDDNAVMQWRGLLDIDNGADINGGTLLGALASHLSWLGTATFGQVPAITGRGLIRAGAGGEFIASTGGVAATSWTVANIPFGVTFPSDPQITLQVISPAGFVSGWTMKVSALSTSQMTVIGNGPLQNWTATRISWTATL